MGPSFVPRQSGRAWPVLLLLLSVLFGSGVVFAADPIRWEATLGFDGAYEVGAWAPVFVDIENQGDSQRGEVVVPVFTRSQTGARPLTNYALQVEVPRNSRKRYLLYAPPERVDQIHLLLGDMERTRDLVGEREASERDALVVVLGGEQGALNFLQGEDAVPATVAYRMDSSGSSGSAVMQVGRAEWDSLPDSWIGWDGVDAAVLADAGFAVASPESMEALLRWVELGGTLIVPGGALSPQMAASPIGALLPIQVQGTAVAPDLAPLSAWSQRPLPKQAVLVASGPLTADATVLCGTAEQPLIALRTVGAGRIAMAAFDYTAAPVKYWDGQTELWQRLLAQAPAPPSVTEQAEYRGEQWLSILSLVDAATYTPAAELPPVWLLLGFLGAYVVLLVPVNYLALKRLDRRELAWITTPAIVVLFTLGAYGLGYSLRGGSIVLNRLAVIEAAPGAALARARGYVGIFSPGRTSYDLLLEDTAASARVLPLGGEGRRAAPTVRYGGEPKVADISMNMWTSRALCVEFLADLENGISGAIEFDGKEVTARVHNGTGLRLRNCRVVRGNHQGQKRDLDPGEEATWGFGRAAGIGDRDRSRGALPAARPSSVKDGMRDQAMRSLFGANPQGSGSIIASEPCLVATVDGPIVPAELDDRRPETNDVSILVARLPFHLASGERIAFARWMASGRMVASDGVLSVGRPWESGTSISEGSVTFEFRVPVAAAGARARALSFALSCQGLSGVSISGYDFRRRDWQTFPVGSGTIRFPDPADYMTQDGRVLVKVAVQGDTLELQEVGLSGEVDTF